MNRLNHEIEHGKKIVEDAEFYWGWGTPAGKERLRRRAEMLIEFGRIGPGKQVLELGCGKGLYTEKLVPGGSTLTAIDISWDLLKAAADQSRSPHYLVGDGHLLPFPDNTFDSVVGVSVLHHLEVPVVLSEAARVLQPGGHFVFSEPNMLNPQIAIQKNVPWIKRLLGDSPDETAFRKGPLRDLLRSSGLEVLEITPFDFLHPWVPKPLIGMVDKTGQLIEKIPWLREIAGSLLIVARKPME